MGARARLITAAAVMSIGRAATAQPVARMLGNDIAHVAGDVAAIWTSPFDASSRDWLLAAGGAGVFSVSMLADRPVAEWAARNHNSRLFHALKPVRSGGAAYTAKFLVPPLAGLYVTGMAIDRQDVREAATGCATSWFAQSMPRQVVYRLVARARPDTSPQDPQRWDLPGSSNWHLQSFPAGHFANAVACATFWSERYRLGLGEPALYALAAASGAGRIIDGGHWFSDTVLGGIIGYATGREVARRSLERAGANPSGQSPARPSPTRRRSGPAIVIPFQYTF